MMAPSTIKQRRKEYFGVFIYFFQQHQAATCQNRSSFFKTKDNMIIDSLMVRNHHPNQLGNLSAFLDRYRAVYPDAKLISAEFYTYHPSAQNGANTLCVFDAQGQMRGFAPLV